MGSPYNNLARTNYWKTAVSKNFKSKSVISNKPLLQQGQKVASAGSCFASNLVPYIEKAGFEYIRCEPIPKSMGGASGDNFGYNNFSARYGNIYTPRQALQLLHRAMGNFRPVESYWVSDEGIVDPFRPGLKYRASCIDEYMAILKSHLSRVIAAIESADVFVFTLGLTESWLSVADGAVFPACPGTISGKYDSDKHFFHNFSVSEILTDTSELIELLQYINPSIKIILTVSPVPLVATFTNNHVLSASIYSKSVLRVCAEEMVSKYSCVDYFPAYELITGPQAPYDFYESDRREPSKEAIDYVMSTFLSSCETDCDINVDELPQVNLNDNITSLASSITDAECEEMAQGRTI